MVDRTPQARGAYVITIIFYFFLAWLGLVGITEIGRLVIRWAI